MMGRVVAERWWSPRTLVGGLHGAGWELRSEGGIQEGRGGGKQTEGWTPGHFFSPGLAGPKKEFVRLDGGLVLSAPLVFFVGASSRLEVYCNRLVLSKCFCKNHTLFDGTFIHLYCTSILYILYNAFAHFYLLNFF